MKAPELLQREVRRFADHLNPTTRDRDLLALFGATRDERAFAEIVRRHGPMVLSTCRRVLRNLADADDAFQAVFVVLLRKACTLHDPDRLGPWLYRVAWRIAMKLRAQRRLEPLPDDVPASEPPSDWLGVFDDLLATLPEKFRTPLVLCYLQGHSVTETAARLQVPAATAATWLHRGRELLRQRLLKRGLVLPTAFLAVVGTGVPDVLAERVASFVSISAIPVTITKLAHSFWERTVMRLLLATGTCTLALGLGVGFFGFTADGQEPKAPPVTPPKTAEAEPAPKAHPTPSVIETKNFHVTAKTSRLAVLLGEHAERIRKEEAMNWFGKELPRWAKPVVIQYDADKKDNSGVTTLEYFLPSGNAVFNPRTLALPTRQPFTAKIQLSGELDVVLSDSLNREVMRCLLANHFGTPVPKWAEEGIGAMCESDEAQQRLRTVANYKTEWMARQSPQELLEAQAYPSKLAMFQAQSYVLCDMLVRRKDRATLLQFITDGLATNWAAAAKKNYGFNDFKEITAALHATAKPTAPPTLPLSATQKSVLSFASATVTKDKLTLLKLVQITLAEIEYVEKTVTTTGNARQPAKVEKKMVPVQKLQPYTAYLREEYKPGDYEASYADGTKLSEKELADLLAKPQDVLVVYESTLSEVHRKLLQPKTLIIAILKITTAVDDEVPAKER